MSLLQEAKARAREKALPGLDLGPDAQQPLGLVFRGASLREAYLALGAGGGSQRHLRPLLPGHDGQPRPQGRGLRPGPERARRGRPDLPPRGGREGPERRAGHAHQAPRVRAAGGEDALPLERRPQGDDRPPARRPRGPAGRARSPATNALTINDTPDKVAAAERIVEIVDKRRAEVVVEVQILEVGAQQAEGVRDLPHLGPRLAGHRGHRLRPLPRPPDQQPERRALRQEQPRGHVAARGRGAPARDRLLDAPPRQPAAARLRGRDRPGPLRRPGPGPGHDLHRDRERRPAPSSRSPRSSTRTSA